MIFDFELVHYIAQLEKKETVDSASSCPYVINLKFLYSRSIDRILNKDADSVSHK